VGAFPGQLTQRYALRTILAASTQGRFSGSEQSQHTDGQALNWWVTRWDS